MHTLFSFELRRNYLTIKSFFESLNLKLLMSQEHELEIDGDNLEAFINDNLMSNLSIKSKDVSYKIPITAYAFKGELNGISITGGLAIMEQYKKKYGDWPVYQVSLTVNSKTASEEELKNIADYMKKEFYDKAILIRNIFGPRPDNWEPKLP